MSRRIHRRPDLKLTVFHGMVTVSPEMLSFFELVRRVGRTDATVLVRGETGTGKELAAQMVHELSPRASKAFRAVNCATFTPELLASELFGHVRGAFTGAVRDRRGLFALADGGTLFLDEIAELPLELQARLLRVLQEQSFVPVGGTDAIDVDVRVVSATNKALREEVEARRFREDLMYRVRVVPLFLPRLADRRGDVEALAWYFIDRFNAQGFREVDGIADDARDAMLAYDWPGNVRELQNVVEYAFAIGEGPTITLDELTPELRGEPSQRSRYSAHPVTERDLERERILDALRDSNGRRDAAAEALGMSRSTLWRKMREYRIAS